MYVDDYGLTALMLCVFQNMSSDKAFRLMDTWDMMCMREKGISYKIIGERYGLLTTSIPNRINRHRKRIEKRSKKIAI